MFQIRRNPTAQLLSKLLGQVKIGDVMKILLYPFLCVWSVAFLIVNIPLALVLPFFADHEGNLPSFLRWFQTPDNPLWGDVGWQKTNPDYSTPWGMTRWLWRNPVQGLDAALRAKLPDWHIAGNNAAIILGNLDIHDGANGIAGWYLMLQEDYFEFNAIVKAPGFNRCLICCFGWRLNDYGVNRGNFVFTPFRVFQFYK